MNTPTIVQIEEAFGRTAPQWRGQCFAVASAMVQHRLVDGTAVYGHWLGPKGTFFGKRTSVPFVQHGWIVTANDVIVDPTRWVFEDKEPYLFVGSDSENYDEGGNHWRYVMRSGPPRSKTGPLKSIFVSNECASHIALMLGDSSVLCRNGVRLAFEQAIWLANSSLQLLGTYAHELYRGLESAEWGALVPIDNKRLAARKAGSL